MYCVSILKEAIKESTPVPYWPQVCEFDVSNCRNMLDLRLVLALGLICLETTIDSLIVHRKRVMLEARAMMKVLLL